MKKKAKSLAEDPLLTEPEAATKLTIHVRTLVEYRREGLIRAIRLPAAYGLSARSIRYRLSEIERFIHEASNCNEASK